MTFKRIIVVIERYKLVDDYFLPIFYVFMYFP